MSDAIDEKIHHFRRRHFPKMELQTDNDPGAAMHPPKEHADAILGCLAIAEIPELHFPIERPPFHQEGRGEDGSVRVVSRCDEKLQMMTRNQFVRGHYTGKMAIIASHRHQFVVMLHLVLGIGHHHAMAPVSRIGQGLLALG